MLQPLHTQCGEHITALCQASMKNSQAYVLYIQSLHVPCMYVGANTELYPHSHSVKYSDLQRGEKLGESGLGTTYKGFWKGTDVAIKFVAGRLVAANQLDSDEVITTIML